MRQRAWTPRSQPLGHGPYPRTDAFGRALLDWTRGGSDPEIIERDDGFIEAGAGPEVYMAPFEEWPSVERRAMRYVQGRVIDVGCGAGRVALHLQDRGFDVVALDASPLAVRAARVLGVAKVWCASVEELGQRIRAFDTVLLFGNNFGMFGTPDRLRSALSKWAISMPTHARVLAESMDPYVGSSIVDRAYRRRNRGKGRMAGQVRIRVRYREWTGPWLDWLFVSRSELSRLVLGTGWSVRRTLGARTSDLFVAVLDRG